jgi:CMP/dCMP kinase
MNKIPIMTLDGPSGSGKGAVGRMLAKQLGWHFLDSGALYRVVALAAIQASIRPRDEVALCALAHAVEIVFEDSGRILLRAGLDPDPYNHDVTTLIRAEDCSQMASEIAELPNLRLALLARQRAFATSPGLVADGRDMGTVVFPEAPFKFFLEASPELRAERRYWQLKETGQNVSLADLQRQMVLRDARDRTRADAPLKPAEDAVVIDTTVLGVEAVCAQIMQMINIPLC